MWGAIMDWMFWMPDGATLNELFMFTGVLWLIHQLVSLGSALFFKSLHDKERFPKLRAQKGKEPAEKLVVSAWKEWLLNHTVSVPIFMALVLYPLFVWRGGTVSVVIPEATEVLIDIAVCVFANETIFYFSHRLLHNKKLFRMIHRKHHTFRQVRPVSSEYAHPVENLLNLIAMYAGLIIMGSSFFTWGLWVALRIYETNDGHSGYEHIDSASRHAFHHQYPTKGCYGTAIGIWDRILGTDKNWREWKAKKHAKAEKASTA